MNELLTIEEYSYLTEGDFAKKMGKRLEDASSSGISFNNLLCLLKNVDCFHREHLSHIQELQTTVNKEEVSCWKKHLL